MRLPGNIIDKGKFYVKKVAKIIIPVKVMHKSLTPGNLTRTALKKVIKQTGNNNFASGSVIKKAIRIHQMAYYNIM